MKFLIINGPNLNMLGIREPDLYGTLTYDGLVEYIAAEARRLGVEAEFYQSNHEGDLVTAIQQAYGRMDGIVINAGLIRIPASPFWTRLRLCPSLPPRCISPTWQNGRISAR